MTLNTRRNVRMSHGLLADNADTSLASLLCSCTRQLSYRKEDRAMHPIYGCTEKFWQSSLRTRPLFQKFVMDFCSDRLRMCVQNFKFVALPVT